MPPRDAIAHHDDWFVVTGDTGATDPLRATKGLARIVGRSDTRIEIRG
jgi:hypothetical protein